MPQVFEMITEKIKFKHSEISNFRLFNQDGLEIYQEDLLFLKDNEILYVSKGEDFKIKTYYSEYKIIQIIGEGGFGKVYLGVHKKTKEKVAIKVTDAGGFENSEDIENIFSESETVRALNHPNIVKIKNFFVIKKTLQTYCIMEYLGGGELEHYLKNKGFLSEEESREIFQQVVSAIGYCHNQKIIHRDLKLENILKVDNESNQIKIVDFGIAGLYAGRKSQVTKAGSIFYLPPEIFEKKNVNASPALDVWAIGIILYQLVIGKFPFEDKNEQGTIKKICHSILEFPKTSKISPEVIDIIKKMLDKNPEKRATINDIRNHPWFLNEKLQDKKLNKRKR